MSIFGQKKPEEKRFDRAFPVDYQVLVQGRGFVPASDLRVGDRLKSANGVATIAKVTVEGSRIIASTDLPPPEPVEFEDDYS